MAAQKNIAAKASEFLAIASRQEKLKHATALAEREGTEEAIQYLVEYLCSDPDASDLSDKLKELLEQSLATEIQDYATDPELKQHFLQLKVNERLVEHLEKKLDVQ